VFEELRAKLTGSIDADARAFDLVMEAIRLPKDTQEQKRARSERMQEGYKVASKVPLETAELCRRVVEELVEMVGKCNQNSASDVAVGLHCAYSGLVGSILNVETNLSAIKDEAFKVGIGARIAALQGGAREKVDEAVGQIRTEFT
jgi:formiminotetrahydrofolate cyclodeaminase